MQAGGLHVELMTRERKKSGEWAKPKLLSIARHDLSGLSDDDDRWLLESMSGATASYGAYDYGGMTPNPASSTLNPTLQSTLVPRLCATGRFLMRPAPAERGAPEAPMVPLEWDPLPVRFQLRIIGDASAGYAVEGVLARDGVAHPLSAIRFITRALVLWAPPDDGGPSRFAALDAQGAERWLALLLRIGPVTIPGTHRDTLVETLALSDTWPATCPDDLRLEPIVDAPRPVLRITQGGNRMAYRTQERFEAAPSFRYGDREVTGTSLDPVVLDLPSRRAWRRDREAEAKALARMLGLGMRQNIDWQSGRPRFDFAAKQLPTIVRVLTSEHWHVEVEGRVHRSAGAVTLDIRSGIDWFELHGQVDFGGASATLPALLAAASRGEGFVTLDDGSVGEVPEGWLGRNGWIAGLGAAAGNHLRFERNQTALLAAWLSAQPAASCDEAFARARGELAAFDGIAPLDPPKTFHGVLRGYQRDALGWFAFLRRFGFGGCLADDMGLGKTVMVLALLDARRLEKGAGPSLIVMPRSLVFNWQEEARRFAPGLRVIDCSGADRLDRFERAGEHDVVLITYGTLRRDIERLKTMTIDYVILDESQAVKNARTNSAMAVRLLRGRHRLALSGTPVENHLGELWSLFEFLNPGMLGASSVLSGASAKRHVDEERLGMIARGVRPFILRRTKEQVAAELPPRTEQTLYCDLEPEQRSHYNELREHYRRTLLQRVERDGLAKSTIYVLEALLRLRQAACHPALIDKTRAGESSAKLDALMPRLQELAEDGRKVLVFSQFTSLLALVRPRLTQAGLEHLYLDGRTKDRAERVRQFETGTAPVFLISLKAGGVGLNLTAAEYVFLLDPWWNPAVEAQAIDRAHRIGQTKPVFAYRLIARDTVEEKVLELQASKRKLADAIVRADEGLVRDLKREDLELLLS
jgi:superfamily II DNA or RNA helicase